MAQTALFIRPMARKKPVAGKYAWVVVFIYIFLALLFTCFALLNLNKKTHQKKHITCWSEFKKKKFCCENWAHLQNPPPHTNRVTIAVAFCYILGMHHVIYWLYPTKSIQINTVIGGEPPNPHLKPYLINQSGIKYMMGDSAVLHQALPIVTVYWTN